MAERRKERKRRLREGGPAAPRRRPLRISTAARPFLLAAISAMLLTLAFPPMEISWIAYVAPAPLLIMALRTRGRRSVFLAGWLGGLIFFALNLHWVWPITAAGFIALTPYMALYWAVFAWAVRRTSDALHVPLAILAPVVWVPLEYLRGWLLTGLPWAFVGHTQYENIVLIQTADLFGAYAQSFLVLMTAGLAADLLMRPLVIPAAAADETADVPGPAPSGGPGSTAGQEARRANAPQAPRANSSGRAGAPRFSRTLVLMVILTAAAWAATVAYGLWRLGQPATRPGPVVASAQTAVPQQVKLEARFKQIVELERQMLQDQVDLTDAAVREAAREGLKLDLVCWPETMVPGTQNREFLEADLPKLTQDAEAAEVFAFYQQRCRLYWQEVRDTARRIGAAVLFGANGTMLDGAIRAPGGGFLLRGPKFNTAFLVLPGSKEYAPAHAYSKVHLVPFGEYVPFKQSWPWLYGLLHGLSPYEHDYNLTPGAADQEPFVLRYGDGREARFQVPICYEDATADRVREMVRSGDPARPKAVDFLVNISNDGWFNGSVELDQHLNLCVFRAVENRVPIVRSVNTGISAIIDSEGRIQAVVERDGRRRNVTGEIVGRLALDDRAAPYTRIGDALALGCLAAAALLLAAALLVDLRNRRAAAGGAKGVRA